LKIGLQITSFTWPGGAAKIGPTLAEIARTADSAGFHSLWVMDHFFQIHGVGKYTEPMLEGYSALNFMAGHTQKVALGSLVSGVSYRTAGFLIKVVTTLDVLSGGRAWLGIGAGWNEQESTALGLPFPPLKERFERLEETLQIARQAWSGDVSAYHGKHYNLAEPVINPQLVSQPHPRIIVGGGGEQKTLRMAAQYGDACNLFGSIGDQALKHKLDVLKRHCDTVGRDYDEIERTTLISTGSKLDAAGLVKTCRDLAAIGFQHVMLYNVPDIHTIKPLEVIGKQVIPEVAAF